MIGNAVDAQVIADWYREVNPDGHYFRLSWEEDLPEGWKYLGDGCYRAAFLSPEGVVYKVEHYEGSGQSNAGEAKRLERLHKKCKMPQGTRLPRYTYYANSNVIAMERFTRLLKDYGRYEQGSPWERLPLVERACKVGDMHGANLAVDQETDELVPIDLGADW